MGREVTVPWSYFWSPGDAVEGGVSSPKPEPLFCSPLSTPLRQTRLLTHWRRLCHSLGHGPGLQTLRIEEGTGQCHQMPTYATPVFPQLTTLWLSQEAQGLLTLQLTAKEFPASAPGPCSEHCPLYSGHFRTSTPGLESWVSHPPLTAQGHSHLCPASLLCLHPGCLL